MPKKHTKSAKTKPGTKAKHSEDFIKQALVTWGKLKAEGKTAAQSAQAIGVHPGMLYFWKARAEKRPWGKAERERHEAKLNAAASRLSGPPPKKAQRMTARAPAAAPAAATRERPRESEVSALKKEIELLKEEIDILTRTITVIARRPG